MLASTHLSICPSAHISVASTGWIFMMFDTGDFTEFCPELQTWLQSNNNIRHSFQRPKYFYIVESSMKYFVA
jgi:hypothetical protein